MHFNRDAERLRGKGEVCVGQLQGEHVPQVWEHTDMEVHYALPKDPGTHQRIGIELQQR